MGVLSHSASDPSLAGPARLHRRCGSASSSLRKTDAGPGEARRLIEDTLFVAHTDNGGIAQWEPFHFVHHEDGSLSFQPLRGCVTADRTLPSQAAQFVLNADWRQPFLAAPWKPLPWDAGDGTPEGPCGGTLFPFTLCYAPLQAKTGDMETGGSKRRTVMLAAADAKTRSRWLAAFAQKAKSMTLRTTAPRMRSEVPLPRAGVGAQAPQGCRSFVALGDMHCGLPTTPSTTSGRDYSAKLKLTPGRTDLWQAKSSLRIVRDLYDGYAADPLAAASLPLTLASARSMDAALPERRTSFLERYLERQAEIENILVQKLSPPAATAPPTPDAEPPAEEDAPAEVEAAGGGGGAAVGAAEAVEAAAPGGFELLARTPNVSLADGVLSAARWSGGALLLPPEEGSFMFTVCPLDPLETNPIFIGIAPRDADLGKVNFFVGGGGVLLCLGGNGPSAFGSSRRASGPSFHALGETTPAQLPLPARGGVVGVHYHEEGGRGHVHFSVGDARGRGLAYARPSLRRPLPAGGWCPCLLLCAPGARLRIRRLA